MEVIKSLELETLEVFGNGDVVSEVGRYVLGGADGQELDEGKYVVVWRKEGDAWKLHRDIFNTSMPPPAPSQDQ
jgi:ketosteroid isomerase-like protein